MKQKVFYSMLVIAILFGASGSKRGRSVVFKRNASTSTITLQNSTDTVELGGNLDITDGTDTYRQLVSSDKWVLQNDASTPLDLIRADSVGNIEIAPTVTNPTVTISSNGADATLNLGTRFSINSNNQVTISALNNGGSNIMFQTKTGGAITDRLNILNDGSISLGTDLGFKLITFGTVDTLCAVKVATTDTVRLVPSR